MAFKLFDHVDISGVNTFKLWTDSLQLRQKATLNEKLDKLAQYGDTLFPQMLTGSAVPGILKLRVRTNVQLRPLLCKGPVNVNDEYTLLLGAIEVGDKLPKGVEDKANALKDAVKKDPANRRKDHETVT